MRLLALPPTSYFASMDAGLRGYKARHHLAMIVHDQGRAAEAEAQWRAVIAERPDFTPAWLGLGEIYLAESRWGEVEQVARGLETAAGSGAEAAVLRARGHRARREYAQARRLIGEVIAHVPQALAPRVFLSHLLLEEGRDWVAARKALEDVLALDPQNDEARGNLARLLEQHAEAAT